MIDTTLRWWTDQCPGWLAAIAGASARATLLLGLAGLVALAWRRAAASARHLLWSLSIGGALAVAPLAALLPAWRLDVAEAAAPAGVEPVRAVAWLTWDVVLLAVWLSGAAVVLAQLVVARARIRALARRARPVTDERRDVLRARMAERGITRAVALVESAEVALPMAWGIRAPAIALPIASRGWTRTAVDAAIAHELAHVRRRDALAQRLAQLACAIYWFHPLAWLAARQMCVLRELACDDEVLAGGTRPSQYAEEVLSIVGALDDVQGLGAVSLGMARRSELTSRLVAVLSPGVARAPLGRTGVIALGTAVIALVLALTVIRPAVAAQKTCAAPTRVVKAAPARTEPAPRAAPAAAPKAAPPARAPKGARTCTQSPHPRRSAR